MHDVLTDCYSNHTIMTPVNVLQVFEGNTDAYSVKHTYLDNVIILRYIKFHTVTWNRHPSMRVEVIGCQGYKHLLHIVFRRSPYLKFLRRLLFDGNR